MPQIIFGTNFASAFWALSTGKNTSAMTPPKSVPSKAQWFRNKENSERERKRTNQRRGAGVMEEERTEGPYLELAASGRVGNGLLAV